MDGAEGAERKLSCRLDCNSMTYSDKRKGPPKRLQAINVSAYQFRIAKIIFAKSKNLFYNIYKDEGGNKGNDIRRD